MNMAKHFLLQSLQLALKKPLAARTTSIISSCSHQYWPKHRQMLLFSTSSSAVADELTKLCPSNLSSTRVSPWLMLPVEQDEMVYKFYSLAEKRVISMKKKASGPDPNAVCVGSSHGWLAFINRRDRAFFLTNPLTRRNIKLPSIETLPVYQGKGFYAIKMVHLTSDFPYSEDCRVLVACYPCVSPYTPPTRLAFCSPGCGDGSSTWNILQSPSVYKCFGYSPNDQKLFCVGKDFRMESWDLCNPSSPIRDEIEEISLDDYRFETSRNTYRSLIKERKHLKRYIPLDKSYLVGDPSSSGQLYLIDRIVAYDAGEDFVAISRDFEEVGEGYRVVPGCTLVVSSKQNRELPYKTIRFDVYKVDIKERVLRYMDSLDDRAFFIGLNQSFILSAKDFPELRPNSIYFTDDRGCCAAYERRPFGGHDIGIYNYKDETVEECYFPIDVKKIKKIVPSPVWLTPNWQ